MVALQSLPALRGLFAGAGSAMMGSSLVVDAVLKLTGKPNASDVTLVYLGTATYDLEKFRSKQCGTFMERGVDVRPFDVACATPALVEVEEFIADHAALLMAFFEPWIRKVNRNKRDACVINQLGEMDIRIRDNRV